MSKVKILLDEDVWVGLAEALRENGYDAISVRALNRMGFSDEEQMAFATADNRTILTHNIQDFAPMVADYFERGIPNSGVIVARQFDKGTLLRRTLTLLKSVTSEEMANTLRFV
ncbi:MAG: DUF5615 family PIN-like protein [Anaerolineae bacterium]|nr:DUF5615 family PIN-like protein [Anaerolineae bacterium]